MTKTVRFSYSVQSGSFAVPNSSYRNALLTLLAGASMSIMTPQSLAHEADATHADHSHGAASHAQHGHGGDEHHHAHHDHASASEATHDHGGDAGYSAHAHAHANEADHAAHDHDHGGEADHAAHAHDHAREIPSEWLALENPLPLTAEILAGGQQTYQQFCSACHGPSGQGDGLAPATAYFDPSPTNLALHGPSHGAAEYAWVISAGNPDSAMPRFATKLSETEIWSVVHYIRHGLANEQEKQTAQLHQH